MLYIWKHCWNRSNNTVTQGVLFSARVFGGLGLLIQQNKALLASLFSSQTPLGIRFTVQPRQDAVPFSSQLALSGSYANSEWSSVCLCLCV